MTMKVELGKYGPEVRLEKGYEESSREYSVGIFPPDDDDDCVPCIYCGRPCDPCNTIDDGHGELAGSAHTHCYNDVWYALTTNELLKPILAALARIAEISGENLRLKAELHKMRSAK